MKFKFYLEESRLYDFLLFPRLLYYNEEFEASKELENYEEIVADDYSDFVKKIEDRLKPFSKEIEIFYMKQYSSEYDFIDLVSRYIGIIGYKNEEDYLNKLLTLNEHDIKKSIIHSILVTNDGYSSYSDKTIKESEKIISDNDKIISFIKELPIEAGVKWNLFLIVQESLKYMKKYVELMTKLLPIFEEIYLPFQNEVEEYGEYLVEFLNDMGAGGLEEITYSILDASILDDNQINILISAMYSYAISIASTAKINYIAWGLRMEEAFKKIKDINENKTYERVQIFKNFGDKTRYGVLKLIASGETSTKKIAKALDVSSATISYHINNILTAKIIKMDKSNNKFGYVIDYELLEETIEEFKKDLNFPGY